MSARMCPSFVGRLRCFHPHLRSRTRLTVRSSALGGGWGQGFWVGWDLGFTGGFLVLANGWLPPRVCCRLGWLPRCGMGGWLVGLGGVVLFVA